MLKSDETQVDVLEDIQEIIEAPNLDTTEKAVLTKARIGQGQYRKNLLAFWKGACAVTGVSTQRLLTASHIKPWKASSNDEKAAEQLLKGIKLVTNKDEILRHMKVMTHLAN